TPFPADDHSAPREEARLFVSGHGKNATFVLRPTGKSLISLRPKSVHFEKFPNKISGLRWIADPERCKPKMARAPLVHFLSENILGG
ncbi:MAG: hypothetical protein LBE86_05520, partial [Gemmobacter sp.]|nr:hypothetical protein [Gemmobacter sp.]